MLYKKKICNKQTKSNDKQLHCGHKSESPPKPVALVYYTVIVSVQGHFSVQTMILSYIYNPYFVFLFIFDYMFYYWWGLLVEERRVGKRCGRFYCFVKHIVLHFTVQKMLYKWSLIWMWKCVLRHPGTCSCISVGLLWLDVPGCLMQSHNGVWGEPAGSSTAGRIGNCI